MDKFDVGQMVLVRNYEGDVWEPAHYAYQTTIGDSEILHIVMGGGNRGFNQCIPLEGNEALIGHTGDSIDHVDYEEPEHQHFNFLDKVEVNINLDGRDDWEPAVYIRYDPEDMCKCAPHGMVLESEDHTIVWAADHEIRPRKQ